MPPHTTRIPFFFLKHLLWNNNYFKGNIIQSMYHTSCQSMSLRLYYHQYPIPSISFAFKGKAWFNVITTEVQTIEALFFLLCHPLVPSTHHHGNQKKLQPNTFASPDDAACKNVCFPESSEPLTQTLEGDVLNQTSTLSILLTWYIC